MIEVVLGLGSNLGDRESELCRALDYLATLTESPIRSSSLYESEPFGFQSSNQFLNMVSMVCIDNVTPHQLLQMLKGYEASRGRRAKKKGGYLDRPIDLDILFFGKEVLNGRELVIPHAEIERRDFVLKPLLEVVPHFFHPVLLMPIEKCLLAEEATSLQLKGELKCI